MAAVNSTYNAAGGSNPPGGNGGGAFTLGASSSAPIPTVVDYTAFASSGTTLAIANKPALKPVATSGAYSDLTGTPALATVATSGIYSDLASKPTIPATVDYNAASSSGTTLAIANKPALKPVATSGVYTDLTGRPALATVATSGLYNDLASKPALATVATSGLYNDLTSKPTIPTTVDYSASSNSGTTLGVINKPTNLAPAANGLRWVPINMYNVIQKAASTITSINTLDGTQQGGSSYAYWTNYAGAVTAHLFQGFYFNNSPDSVTLPAGTFQLNVPAIFHQTGNVFCLFGWDFAPNAGVRLLSELGPFLATTTALVYSGGRPLSNAIFQSTQSAPYAGFVSQAYTTPLFTGQMYEDINYGDGPISANSNAVTLPPGWSELRLGIYWSNNDASLNTLAPAPTMTGLTGMYPVPASIDNIPLRNLTVAGTLTLGAGPAAIAFPTAAMTGPTTAGFTASSSSQTTGFPAYLAFDRTTANPWASGNTYDSVNSGVYTGSTTTSVGGSSINGEWLQLQTPVPYGLVSYTVTDTAGRQKRWVLAGSLDGVVWNNIDSRVLTTVPTIATTYTPVNSVGPYSFYRYIVQQVVGNAITNLAEISFNGLPYSTSGSLSVGGTLTAKTYYSWYYLQTANTNTVSGNPNVTASLFAYQAGVSSPFCINNLFTTDVASNTSSTGSGAQLLFPYSGIYSLCWQARFNAAASENSIWFIPMTTTTYSNNNNNARLAYASTGSLNVMTNYTGFFTAGDKVAMNGYSSVSNFMTNTLGAGLTVVLLQRTA